jgi:2-polyprenyl-3-methyl-5-hydroxy-6-metoxy-1,4-benzoquinol methylase
MDRSLQPELLDTLPSDHPAALHSRRDLRLINRFMRTRPWMIGELRRWLRTGERVLELGAGTGELALALNAAGFSVDGLDLWPQPAGWPASARWHQADLRTFPHYGDYTVIMGSLIFHQFSAEELAALGQRCQQARVILASEPARWKRAQVLMSLIGPVFGASYVTKHDARVSIAAGFLGNELPGLLTLDPQRWSWDCHTGGFGVYRMTVHHR